MGLCSNSSFPICSTRETRQPGKGWYAIQQHVMRLGAVHMQHMMVYGQGNIKRLLSPDAGRQHLAFTWGLEQKSASVCIPHSVLLQQQGHLEDRRPGQCLPCSAQPCPQTCI